MSKEDREVESERNSLEVKAERKDRANNSHKWEWAMDLMQDGT